MIKTPSLPGRLFAYIGTFYLLEELELDIEELFPLLLWEILIEIV